jgi:hypothetical protein
MAWKRWPGGRTIAPGLMNNNTPHPIEALILLALVLLEALAVLAVALVALLLTLARWKPSAAAPPAAMPQSHRHRQRLACLLEEIDRKRRLLEWLENPDPLAMLQETDDDLPHAPAADPYR